MKKQKVYIQIEGEKQEQQTPTTSIPESDWGVHITHCCDKHGCKYGDQDCPVALGLAAPKYACEFCTDDTFLEDNNLQETEGFFFTPEELEGYLLDIQNKIIDKFSATDSQSTTHTLLIRSVFNKTIDDLVSSN